MRDRSPRFKRGMDAFNLLGHRNGDSRVVRLCRNRSCDSYTNDTGFRHSMAFPNMLGAMGKFKRFNPKQTLAPKATLKPTSVVFGQNRRHVTDV